MNKKTIIATAKATSALLLLAIVAIGYLIYKNVKEKQSHEADNDENKKRLNEKDIEITAANNSSLYFQNAYISSTNLAQYLEKQIPNPEEAVKKIIEHLLKIKNEIFNNEESYSKEIDNAIKSLKMETLHLSFSVLAKIIEKMMGESFIENEDFKEKYKEKISKNKSFNLGNYITFASEKGLLSENIEFLNIIKNLRNDAVHEISPDTDKNFLIAAHQGCIEIIEKIIFEPWFNTKILKKTKKQVDTDLVTI